MMWPRVPTLSGLISRLQAPALRLSGLISRLLLAAVVRAAAAGIRRGGRCDRSMVAAAAAVSTGVEVHWGKWTLLLLLLLKDLYQ